MGIELGQLSKKLELQPTWIAAELSQKQRNPEFLMTLLEPLSLVMPEARTIFLTC